MKLTFIDCSCGNTKGFQLANNIAECTSCAKPNHVDTPTYHAYELDSLSDIEQRAREQAVKDMLDEWHLECHENYQNYLDEQLDSMYRRDKAGQDACALDAGIIIDWSTCFDVDNIEQRVGI